MEPLARRMSVLLVVTCLAVVSAGFSMPLGSGLAAQVSSTDAAGSRAEAVDALFESRDHPGRPGASVLVMEHGEVLHMEGYGQADLAYGVSVAPTTVFDVASVAKQFTGLAVAILAEDGLISLDDDVRQYIPELPDFGHRITVEHLLYHTSGLRDWPGALALAGWNVSDLLSSDEILGMVYRQRELNFPPGTDFAYSNTGYNVLAEICDPGHRHSVSRVDRRAHLRPPGNAEHPVSPRPAGGRS